MLQKKQMSALFITLHGHFSVLPCAFLNDNDTNYSLAILIAKPESREREKGGRGKKGVCLFTVAKC